MVNQFLPCSAAQGGPVPDSWCPSLGIHGVTKRITLCFDRVKRELYDIDSSFAVFVTQVSPEWIVVNGYINGGSPKTVPTLA